MQTDFLIACHECDLIHRIVGHPEGGTSTCSRCGAVLVSHKRNSLDRSLALTLTGGSWCALLWAQTPGPSVEVSLSVGWRF